MECADVIHQLFAAFLSFFIPSTEEKTRENVPSMKILENIFWKLNFIQIF